MTALPARRLRDLPSVDQVLQTPLGSTAIQRFGRQLATAAVRAALAAAREACRGGAAVPQPSDVAADAVGQLKAAERPSLRPVFNLTGTVLHTNLGRAPLAEEAIEAVRAAMREAVALEFDLDTGKRGERDDHLRSLVCELTGAEDATVVNNNAAAVLLVLNTLALDREAIVSRGELIEIGGSFRMPEIMARAGAKVVEVGTTNRTHPKDYVAAIGQETGLVLKVHTSNYRVEGFTAEVGARELASIAKARGVPLVHDLGSGTLFDLAAYGLKHEPTVREAIADGADLVTFSGDKLLGGPQAGFIVGSKALLAAISLNPMKRALRVDKLRLAALEATLKLYRDPDRLAERLPTLRLLARPSAEIAAQAERLAPMVADALGEAFVVETVECRSQVGSGALPLETISSAGLALRVKSGGGKALEALAAALRRLRVPVIGRIENRALVLDLRCLDDEAGFRANLAGFDPGGADALV
ncbi:L-seryl-tRNA(Sec) selenium transferase [Mesorhizobium sp.]|uniref:L-seryl-tRNA(Sec) selenium transferase n=1 Tax=Mesorhizobium sp. TaxID=1871066 RepID=UPI00120F392A|nr:L-seryl-tRNA(Sec) selenium transferase [Mesorhizobium sp.]TIO05741.1 MAG: L-seryl-tRNA(Sec) selenium transferase [Mesorhizobium sp.]TIO33136.1 MAG: L-seryl-tRNA(Sec) selenium transferase [Mesorhizobium sp.]TIP08256.1 MAG: L-seryl-tRNA(Sec) selenium transferase [Mesorhizobium sp.]